MSSAALNVFQRLARQWDLAHPYNAAQILKIQGSADPAILHFAWHQTLNTLGLGRVQLNGRSFHYECLNGEMSLYGVRVVRPGTTLEDFISEQLNRRFDNPAEPPFRPFVLFDSGFYYLGVVYHHWVADSVSIRTVLREWFLRLFDPTKARHTPLPLSTTGYSRFFSKLDGIFGVGHGLLTAARWASTLRQARRVEYYCGNDLTVRFAIHSAPTGWIDTLHASARRLNVTLNDLFLAAIAQVCEHHVPLKHRPHRHSIALGSIVDLRPYTQHTLAETFGLLLGFTNVICHPWELQNPQQLLRSISRQTLQQKRRGLPQASALRLLVGAAAGHFLRPERMAHFYQKHIPLAAGISNVNLNRSWATDYHPTPLLDYIRVSPTGPMMPLVFATTTLGHNFHFALTYRPSVVSPTQINPLAQTFTHSLASYTHP